MPPTWVTDDYTHVLNFICDTTLIDADDGIAMDTETNGLTVFGNPEFRMVGIGFAHGSRGIYLDTGNMTYVDVRTALTAIRNELISTGKSLICHNLFYDMSVTRFYLRRGNDLPFIADTYGHMRYLASEGFFGQKYSLKVVMTEMLLWSDTNETGRDEWLIANGFVNNQGKVRKGDMWRVPADILGPYCILDSYATYQFYREIILPAMNTYTPQLYRWFHTEVFVGCLVTECVTNYEMGIFIDRDILLHYDTKLIGDIAGIKRRMYRDLRGIIDGINRTLLQKHMDKCPAIRYKTVKPIDATCPDVRTKGGALSKNYIRFMLRWRRCERQLAVGGEINPAYARFRKFRRDLKYWQYKTPVFDPGVTPEAFKPHMFNLNSVAHKTLLLYDNLPTVEIRPWESKQKVGAFVLPNGIELEYTKSGARPTGRPAIMAIMGGRASLSIYNGELKKQQFTRSVLAKITNESRIHLPVKVPGTYTGRCGGDGGLNIQNIVKDPTFLSAWRVENPLQQVIFANDFAALEPHVLTELSRDTSMMALYGPGAAPNDIYLYTAAKMRGAIGQPFLDEGYNPDKPTAAAMDACKHKFKKLRNVAKVLVLSDNYGSGVAKKHRSLRIMGYDYTVAQIQDMQNRLNAVYAGAKAFGKKLQAEHERNGGFVLDALGFPTPVCVDKRRDVVNRVVQKSGHMILMVYLWKFTQLLRENNVEYQHLIFDYHDETIPIFNAVDVPIVRRLYAQALSWLNDEFLHATVKLKAVPEVATSLADIKCEGHKIEDAEIAAFIADLNDDDDGDDE